MKTRTISCRCGVFHARGRRPCLHGSYMQYPTTSMCYMQRRRAGCSLFGPAQCSVAGTNIVFFCSHNTSHNVYYVKSQHYRNLRVLEGRLRKRKNRTLRLLANDGLREDLLRKRRCLVSLWSGCSRNPFLLGATINGEFREAQAALNTRISM